MKLALMRPEPMVSIASHNPAVTALAWGPRTPIPGPSLKPRPWEAKWRLGEFGNAADNGAQNGCPGPAKAVTAGLWEAMLTIGSGRIRASFIKAVRSELHIS